MVTKASGSLGHRVPGTRGSSRSEMPGAQCVGCCQRSLEVQSGLTRVTVGGQRWGTPPHPPTSLALGSTLWHPISTSAWALGSWPVFRAWALQREERLDLPGPSAVSLSWGRRCLDYIKNQRGNTSRENVCLGEGVK